MSDRDWPTEWVEAAARAISVYDWDNAVSLNPEVSRHQRGEALAVLAALADAGALLPAGTETEWAWDCGYSFPGGGACLHPISEEKVVRELVAERGVRAMRRRVGPWEEVPTDG